MLWEWVRTEARDFWRRFWDEAILSEFAIIFIGAGFVLGAIILLIVTYVTMAV